jgi:hypothetical protein
VEQISWGEPAQCYKFAEVFPTTKAFANAFNFDVSVNNDGCFNSAESLYGASGMRAIIYFAALAVLLLVIGA